MRSLSSSPTFRFLPHILQATTATPPIIIAPPIPTTTPMIVRLVDGLNPELFELLSLPASPGAAVEVEVDVETATSALVVRTWLNVLLPLTVTIVDVTC